MNSPQAEKKMAKYEVVKQYILSMIECEALKPGDKVPTEEELSEQFSVSLTTTRRALLDLSRDGVICRIKKKGTFVNQSPPLSISSNTSPHIVSFILPLSERTDNNLMQHVRGAQEYFSERGYSMLFMGTNDSVESENRFINKAIQEQSSGLIIFPAAPEENYETLFKLRQHNIPFVLVDRYPEGLPVNSVVCDNFDGAFQATEHLISLGHEKILFVTYVGSNQAEIVRHNGYCMAMKAHNLRDDFPVFSYQQKDEILQAIRTGQYTAFVCANDYCALDLLRFLSSKGVSIPEDVSIVGFDGQRATEFVTPPLTTVLQPCYEIGRTAAELLVDIIENPRNDLTQTVLPIRLDIRKSTAPPKK